MPVVHLAIIVDNKTFHKFARTANKSLTPKHSLTLTNEINIYIEKLNLPNEFVRLKCHDYYIDMTIKDILIKEKQIIIQFTKIIDYNTTKYIQR